jgi:thiol-disulfide isomerase/thioredoxin
MLGRTQRRLIQHSAMAAALLLLAGVAALALNFYGSAFLRSPARQPIPAGADADQSAASPDGGKTLSFLAQPRPMPAIRFVDGDGHAMTLADFHGRVVLLNVWATWCVPCRKEMPALDRLQAALGAPDFQVVPLSIDRQGAAVVKPFYRDLGLKALGIYIDQTGDATQALKTVGVPTSVLIDRSGREIARKMGAAEWDSPEMVQLIQQHLGPPAQ